MECLLRVPFDGHCRAHPLAPVDALARARTSSIVEVMAEHTRGVWDVVRRAASLRDTARRWVEFWSDHLDLGGPRVGDGRTVGRPGRERRQRQGLMYILPRWQVHITDRR